MNIHNCPLQNHKGAYQAHIHVDIPRAKYCRYGQVSMNNNTSRWCLACVLHLNFMPSSLGFTSCATMRFHQTPRFCDLPLTWKLGQSTRQQSTIMLELHVWGPGFGLPSIDPHCLAAIAYLQQAIPKGKWQLIASSDASLSPSSMQFLRSHDVVADGTMQMSCQHYVTARSG